MEALKVFASETVFMRDGQMPVLSPIIQAINLAYTYCGIGVPADLHWAAAEARAPSFYQPGLTVAAL